MLTPISDDGWKVDFGDVIGELIFSPMTDTVHRFPDADLDHLHFWDDEAGHFRLLFIGSVACDKMVELGIPETHRDSITSYEHEHWVDWVVANNTDDLDIVEPEDFTDTDDSLD